MPYQSFGLFISQGCFFLFLFDGRPSEAKGSLNWDIPTSGGWRLVMPPSQYKYWGTNLVLLPYAGGQA